ncbi:MAG: fatty acid hydroxylase, partial [Candidatus Kapaibacteriota bacterium]
MASIISNEELTPRLFRNNVLEFLSRVSWYVPLLLYIPVIATSLFFSIVYYNFNVLYIATLFVCGIFSWTLVEYILHRFVFHYQPKTNVGKKIHFIFHGVHHSYPKDPLRLVMP